jgi:hypothetical protein
MGATATTADRRIGLALRGNGLLAGRGANPRIRLDSLQLMRMVDKLFTGNMTVARQRAIRPVYRIVREKLTIGSERFIESASYDIAQNLGKISKDRRQL